MALCTVTGTVYLPDGSLARSRTLLFQRQTDAVQGEYLGSVIPDRISTQTTTAGAVSVQLLTGIYAMFAEGRDGRVYTGRVTVPDATTATLGAILDAAPPVTPVQTATIIITFTDEAAFNAFTPEPNELAVLVDG